MCCVWINRCRLLKKVTDVEMTELMDVDGIVDPREVTSIPRNGFDNSACDAERLAPLDTVRAVEICLNAVVARALAVR